MKNAIDIGQGMESMRKEKRMYMHEVATAMGCSQATVSHLETGFVHVRWQRLCSFADALGVTVEEIIARARNLRGSPRFMNGCRFRRPGDETQKPK